MNKVLPGCLEQVQQLAMQKPEKLGGKSFNTRQTHG